MSKFTNSEIIEKLSLKEKIGLLTGDGFWKTKGIESEGLKGLLLTDGPSGIRKQSSEKEDALGINGSIETISFPSTSLIACSFDRELLHDYGTHLGKLAKSENINILLGPGINIKRNPLCGRNFEYFSEDPLLTSELAASYINGLESQGVGSSVKHYAANNRENQRFTNSSNIDERTLREIYLLPFENVIKNSNPATIMCSYNKLNGILVSQNKFLLDTILRKEWGYQGVVVSDWAAVKDRIPSLKAGLDLEMPEGGIENIEKLNDFISEDPSNIDIINKSVDRLISLLKKYQQNQEVSINKEDYHNKSRKYAENSIVLLKNENKILPIKKEKSTLFVGSLAENPRFQGGGSSNVNAFKISSPLKSAKKHSINYQKGYIIDDSKVDEKLENEAISASKDHDQIVMFLGYPQSYESEGYDKKSMELPFNQLSLLDKISKVNNNIIVVLQNGGIVDMSWDHKVSAILETYLGGQAIGEAITNILYGEINPSGKLAETIPKRIEDVPSFLTFNKSKESEDYIEGIYVGYRYYETKEIEVKYPFGHGLSYTEFEYTEFDIEVLKNSIKVSFNLFNKGEMSGKEISQLYLTNLCSDTHMPKKVLVDFESTYLKPKEKKQVIMEVPKDRLKWFNKNKWQLDSGSYKFMLGSSSKDIRKEEIVRVNLEDTPKKIKIHEDMYLNEINDLEHLIPRSIEKYKVNRLLEEFDDKEEVKELFNNMPLRSLVMIGFNSDSINNFIKEANKEIQ